MTDSWERRALPNVPGWNNVGGSTNFIVVYDPNTDTLTITASQPVLTPVDTINFQDSLGNGTMTLAQTDFTVDSPTQITVTIFSTHVGEPSDLTQLDFFNGATLIGTWTGTVHIELPTPAPIVQISSADVRYLNTNDPSGQGFIDGSNMGTAQANPGVNLSLNYAGGTDADIAYVVLIDPINGNAGIDVTGGTVSASFGTDSGQFLAWDAVNLPGRIITAVEIWDSMAAVIDSFTLPVPVELYSVADAGVLSTDDSTLVIDFTGPVTNLPSFVAFFHLGLPGNTYSFQAGPYVPSDPEVVEWSVNRIEINDPVAMPPGAAATANGLQVLVTADGSGSYALYEQPIPLIAPEVFDSSQSMYFDDNAIDGNFSCANIATAVAIPGIAFNTSKLILGGAVGIQVQTDTGNLNFRHDLNPGDWLTWTNDTASLKHASLVGRHATYIVAIDSSNTPIGTGAAVDFEFYDVTDGTAGKVTGDPTKIHVPFATPALVVPPSLWVEDCTLGIFEVWDPAGPNGGTNAITTIITQWDVNGIEYTDATLASWNIQRVSVLNAAGFGYEDYGDPLPTVAA